MTLSPLVLRTGGPTFLPHSTVLRAGPLTLLLEQGEIRRVKLGETEILRRIYLAVRGSDWRTIPPALADLQVDVGADAFKATYTLVHRQDEFDFSWSVEVEGDAQGRLRFRALGRSASAFLTNRVGMCLLHPPRECAGRPARRTGPGGKSEDGHFPDLISPHEPFKEIQAFSHQLEDGTWVDFAYEGEVFEMEDQRNWTDGSFKTYCPPAHRPKPRSIVPGFEFDHAVTLTLRRPAGCGAAAVPGPRAAPEPVRIALGAGTSRVLPALGHGLPSHGREPGPRDAARLRALAPSHLRANFDLDRPGLAQAAARAAAQAAALGAPLEAALVVGEEVDASLAALRAVFHAISPRGAQASRWLVFHRKSDSTPEPVFAAAVASLRELGATGEAALGSKNDFVLLNRGRPALDTEAAGAARLVYAMCPQVHAFDNRNLVESLEGQEWTLRTARGLFPRHAPVISTVSIKRTPFAASLKLSGPPPSDAWLKQADARQLSLFGAGWTLASIKRLAGNGAAAATYYETTGPLGLVAGESLAPGERNLPGVDFRLEPGWVFPLYHVFADLAEMKGGEQLSAESPQPLRCEVLALRQGGRRMALVANLEEKPCAVRIEGLPSEARLRIMDEKSAARAVEDAEGYREAAPSALSPQAGGATVELPPFAWARLDFA